MLSDDILYLLRKELGDVGLNEICVASIEGVWFGVACEGQRVYATSFAVNYEKALRNLLDSIPFRMPFRVSTGSVFADKVLRLLKSIYDGEDANLNVSLTTDYLPEYTQKVLQAVSQIPAGYVASYGAVAEAVGGGARAVGNVMAANPFPLLVPCHRVVSSGMGLGGYGGGLDVKYNLLEHEKHGYTKTREIPINSGRLRVFPVEAVLEKLEIKPPTRYP